MTTVAVVNRQSTMEELEMTKRDEQSRALLPMGRSSMSDDDSSRSDSSLSDELELNDRATGESSPVESSPVERKRRCLLGRQPAKEIDVAKYMAKREMTPAQERVNAVTMLPGLIYCVYYVLSGVWLSSALVAQAEEDNDMNMDAEECLSASWLPWLHAMPPLPVLAVAAATIVHTPFSFLYHWTYAHSLDLETRTGHWSRRMDQSMIHVASALLAYGTSGSVNVFIANMLYNADCVYRQFQTEVKPRRNKIRILFSIIAYTIPVLRRGEFLLFGELWIIFGISGWLFAKYPIGGWSHSAFHLLIALVAPLLMSAACELSVSQEQLQVAAKCSVLSAQQ